jgi:hypothetical protein
VGGYISVGVLPNDMATSVLKLQNVINIACFTSPIDCIFPLDLISMSLAAIKKLLFYEEDLSFLDVELRPLVYAADASVSQRFS